MAARFLCIYKEAQHTCYLILENEEEKLIGNLQDDKQFH